MADQIGLDAVAGQPHRAAFEQRFGADAQHGFQKIDRRVAPERAVEPLAETDTGGCRVMHGRRHQFAAAEFEEAAVTEAVARRPIEHAHGVGFRYPLAQHLARFVPVDQENERGADRREEVVARLGIAAAEAAGDQIEHAVVAEAFRALAVEPAPFDGEIAEQAGEEFRAHQMHVGIGDGHRVRLDRDHHHMRVGFADVVLDGEPRARARGGGGKAGMIEFQLAGRFQPAHESLDRGAVLFQQAIHMRAGQPSSACEAERRLSALCKSITRRCRLSPLPPKFR